MTKAIVPTSPALNAIAKAKTPAESKKLESVSAAAIAWAKEERNYEGVVKATLAYIMARRKTTELLKPFIKHGGNRQGNGSVTLPATLMEKTGFTRMQWSRRVRELEVDVEDIEEYFDECTSNGWNPSLGGLLRHVRGGESKSSRSHDPVTCPNCGAVFSG